MKRLTDHALGKISMKSTQVKAADILLRKCVPDLQRTELTGANGDPIEIRSAKNDEGL